MQVGHVPHVDQAERQLGRALPFGWRIELNRRYLAVLQVAAPAVDPARLAHHADAAGDGAAVLTYGPLAAERSATLGAHREAAAHYGAVLRHANRLTPAERAELLERRSYECYLTDQLAPAIEARQEALEWWRGAGDARRVGDSLRWLSRLYWFVTRNDALAAGREAVATLEGEPAGRELAMAYSNPEVLALLAERLSNTAIAHQLVLSRKTVDHHVSAVLRKLGVSTRIEAVRAGERLGLTPAPHAQR